MVQPEAGVFDRLLHLLLWRSLWAPGAVDASGAAGVHESAHSLDDGSEWSGKDLKH
jgi:hypothetical protein